MREKRIIQLKKPLTAPKTDKCPDGVVNQIVFREPTFDEYLVHGDPYTVAQSPGGTTFISEDIGVIGAYIRVCIVEPEDPAVLSQANARVAKQVKEAILDFFRPDAAKAEASETSETNSPSPAPGETSPTSNP